MVQTYVHWHPVAYILNELCADPKHEHVEKAWRIIDMAYRNPHGVPPEANIATWKPLRGLLERAQAARTKAGLDLSLQYMTPSSIPAAEIPTAMPVQILSIETGSDYMPLPIENLVPADESLMAFDLSTPYTTMSNFMTREADQYPVDPSWWMNGDIAMPNNPNMMIDHHQQT